MPYLIVLLFAIMVAPLGWPLAWLVAHGYRRVSYRVSAARLRLFVMAFLGIALAVLTFVDRNRPFEATWVYTLGVLIRVAGYPIGWVLSAAVIELAIRSRKARATAS